VPEEEEPKELEFDMKMDICYVLTDYPCERVEWEALGQKSTGLNLLVNVEVNFVEESEIKNETHSQASKQNRSGANESGIEDPDRSIVKEDGPHEVADRNLDDSERAVIEQRKKFERLLADARMKSVKGSMLRNACSQNISYTMNIRNLEPAYEAFKDVFVKFICDFSLEIEKFNTWNAKRTPVPLGGEGAASTETKLTT
jgi:hypothetical protein